MELNKITIKAMTEGIYHELEFLGFVLAPLFAAGVFVCGIISLAHCILKRYPLWPVIVFMIIAIAAFVLTVFGKTDLGYMLFFYSSPLIAVMLIIGLAQQYRINHRKWIMKNQAPLFTNDKTQNHGNI